MLIDSGADDNLIEADLVKQANILVQPLESPNALDNHLTTFSKAPITLVIRVATTNQ